VEENLEEDSENDDSYDPDEKNESDPSENTDLIHEYNDEQMGNDK